jgi:hypothetical protein
MTGVYHYAQLLLIKMGFKTFFAQAGLKPQSYQQRVGFELKRVCPVLLPCSVVITVVIPITDMGISVEQM